MKSDLMERFKKLGPVKQVVQNTTGEETVLMLRMPPNPRIAPKVGEIVLALAENGISMLRAKRAVETAMDKGSEVVVLRKVKDLAELAAKLSSLGLVIGSPNKQSVDVAALREKLQLSRRQFGLRFGIPVSTLRKWEDGERQPDSASNAWLHTIEKDPASAEMAYAPSLQEPESAASMGM